MCHASRLARAECRRVRTKSIGTSSFLSGPCTVDGYVPPRSSMKNLWRVGFTRGGFARLTRDGGNDDGGAQESAGWRREKRRHTRNTKFSSCRRWHEERRWNFYNDTFCARDYFRDVLAGIERGRGARALLRENSRECRKWIHMSTSCTYGIFFMPCGRSTNVENMLWKLAYTSVLFSVTYIDRNGCGGDYCMTYRL